MPSFVATRLHWKYPVDEENEEGDPDEEDPELAGAVPGEGATILGLEWEAEKHGGPEPPLPEHGEVVRLLLGQREEEGEGVEFSARWAFVVLSLFIFVPCSILLSYTLPLFHSHSLNTILSNFLSLFCTPSLSITHSLYASVSPHTHTPSSFSLPPALSLHIILFIF